MSFNPNIPLPTDFLSQSQQDILTNFQTADTSQGVNHYQFSDVTANNGKHKFVQMPENAAPTTAVDEGAVYTKVGVGPAETNLWFRAEDSGGGGGFEYQLTHVIAAQTGRFGNNTAYAANHEGGWTFLPGGLLLQYGRRLTPGDDGTITYPVPFPSTNPPFMIQLTTRRTSARTASVNTASISSTSFDYFCDTGGSNSLYWMAIGL